MMIILTLLLLFIITLITWRITFNKCGYNCYLATRDRDKFFAMYQLSIHWIECMQTNKKISEYIKKRGWNSVAVYGCADLGCLLYKELSEAGINVLYGIDKNKNTNFPIKSISLQEINNYEKPDVIIVTAIAYYSSIYEELKERCEVDIISLEDIIYELLY